MEKCVSPISFQVNTIFQALVFFSITFFNIIFRSRYVTYLYCSGNITTIEIKKVTYRVLDADPSTKILKIVREDYLVGGICSPDFVDTTLDSELFDYGHGDVNITLLYGCPPTNIPSQMTYFPFSCTIDGIANKGG
jgi:hypothetical protein